MNKEFMNGLVNYKLIGKRIAKRRKELNITQNKLAELCELDVTTISKMENGKTTLHVNTLALISYYLQVELIFFINGSGKFDKNYKKRETYEKASKLTKDRADKLYKVSEFLEKYVLNDEDNDEEEN